MSNPRPTHLRGLERPSRPRNKKKGGRKKEGGKGIDTHRFPSQTARKPGPLAGQRVLIRRKGGKEKKKKRGGGESEQGMEALTSLLSNLHLSLLQERGGKKEEKEGRREKKGEGGKKKKTAFAITTGADVMLFQEEEKRRRKGKRKDAPANFPSTMGSLVSNHIMARGRRGGRGGGRVRLCPSIRDL